jgi:hypothetical protein
MIALKIEINIEGKEGFVNSFHSLRGVAANLTMRELESATHTSDLNFASRKCSFTLSNHKKIEIQLNY